MHVFLTGPVQIGKSTLLRASLDALQPQKLGGFRTVSAQPQADGSRPVYLHPACSPDELHESANRIGIRRPGLGIVSFPAAFETAGLAALAGAEDCDLLLMDEIGRMERRAEALFRAHPDAAGRRRAHPRRRPEKGRHPAGPGHPLPPPRPPDRGIRRKPRYPPPHHPRSPAELSIPDIQTAPLAKASGAVFSRKFCTGRRAHPAKADGGQYRAFPQLMPTRTSSRGSR